MRAAQAEKDAKRARRRQNCAERTDAETADHRKKTCAHAVDPDAMHFAGTARCAKAPDGDRLRMRAELLWRKRAPRNVEPPMNGRLLRCGIALNPRGKRTCDSDRPNAHCACCCSCSIDPPRYRCCGMKCSATRTSKYAQQIKELFYAQTVHSRTTAHLL